MKPPRILIAILIAAAAAVLAILPCLWAGRWGYGRAHADAVARHQRSTYALTSEQALVSRPQQHTIQRGETLLDIARLYNLGFNEIQLLYPHWDPWLPAVGDKVIIPSCWLLPEARRTGVVINVAELRLYLFKEALGQVTTFPISIGEEEAATPTGTFTISEKKEHPAWAVPPSLRHKYDVKWFPPGPDNPLGEFWMGLDGTRFGIHGTDIPWSIGRLVTHGCIRLYPEDIEDLFEQVPVGTRVRLIYQPVKIGLCEQRVFVEVHPDVYGLIGDLVSFGFALLHAREMVHRVDPGKMYRALKRPNGLPVDVTRDKLLQAVEEEE